MYCTWGMQVLWPQEHDWGDEPHETFDRQDEVYKYVCMQYTYSI